jgi:hypothetical protein
MKEEIRRIDPFTKEEFTAVRVNQRFAISANRIKFHNSQANELRKETSVINIPIAKTHRLYRKLMGDKREAVFSYDYLKGYGVNLSVFNHLVKINGEKYQAIHEFVIILLDENSVKIINYDRY